MRRPVIAGLRLIIFLSEQRPHEPDIPFQSGILCSRGIFHIDLGTRWPTMPKSFQIRFDWLFGQPPRRQFFKFMGRLYIGNPRRQNRSWIAFRQGKGIDQAILAGCSLAGNHWTDLGAGFSGPGALPCTRNSRIGSNVFKGDP